VWVIVGIAVAIIGLLWLAEDTGVGPRMIQIGADGNAKPPSWGDVADKVGEFANAEAELKQTIGAGQSGGGDSAGGGDGPKP
jgi:hypothetical protein